jgi:hypothetical protein
MKVSDLIKLLEEHQRKYGPDSQIAVPRFTSFDCCGEETYIEMSPIWTVLCSKGEEVQW